MILTTLAYLALLTPAAPHKPCITFDCYQAAAQTLLDGSEAAFTAKLADMRRTAVTKEQKRQVVIGMPTYKAHEALNRTMNSPTRTDIELLKLGLAAANCDLAFLDGKQKSSGDCLSALQDVIDYYHSIGVHEEQ
jgi:hypothetical protein